jgi:hypothetical protein
MSILSELGTKIGTQLKTLANSIAGIDTRVEVLENAPISSSTSSSSSNNIDITWTASSTIDVLNNNKTLRRINHNDQWDAQAYSNQSLNGSCIFSCTLGGEGDGGANHAMIGLNTDPITNASYTSIDYCWYFDNGYTRVYENGTSRGDVGTWNVGSTYSIEYNGTQILYKQDGVIKRTVSVSNGLTFYVDSSFYSDIILNDISFGQTAYINNASVAFAAKSSLAGNTGSSGIITFNNITYNAGNAWSGTRFTAPKAGLYQFNCVLLSRSGGYMRADILVNGGSTAYRTESTQSASNYQQSSTAQAIYLNAGDYVEFSSGSYATYAGDYDFCSGFLIG